ncbi:hypothetical protein JTE90_010400 [Oedothorax gibbosus]|uniref:CWH43-like N-terminal domain-containing protein n=1 Tax=Oedothorax gibbosus TaxID=931172 RepID=A0AAV6W5A0_9ARAC|nr:hypothetical protein JTE90_010400 [Oedothorax gibbosus]
MESKGNDALLKTTQVTEWSLKNGGYISLAFGGLLLLGCLVAYLIAVARGNVDAILPLISDAAGSPPQNGFFGTLVCLGGMCGVVFMIQRYMIVLEKNKGRSSLVLHINKISLVIGILSMLGITLITGYPINFYRNRDVWMMDVGIPHMIGGVMLFSLGLCYIALQCILTLFLKRKNENAFSLRVLLLFICTSAFVYHMITVPEHFGGVSHLYYSNETVDNEFNDTGILPYPPTMGASLKIPIDTGGSYVNSAIAQWIFVFFFCCFFFTFFKEAQEYSMLIVIETHTTQEQPEEPRRPDYQKQISLISNGSQISKPDTEVRKLLRRDSTCQTMTDDILYPKNGITNGKKDEIESSKTDKKIPKFNSEVDAKLTRLLSVCETTDEELKTQSIETSVAETNTTSVDIESTTTVGRMALDGENVSPKETAPIASTEDGAEYNATEESLKAESSETISRSENNTTNAVSENLSTSGNIVISKEDEERIAIEHIDVAVKDAEENSKITVQENESVKSQPSNCPMSVQ